MTEPILKIDHLSKQFTVGDENVTALYDTNFEINAGDFIVIYGPSGCGKTTLLSLIAGLDLPDSGSISYKSQDLYHLKPDALAYYRRTQIGMVFQHFNLIPTLSAADNVAMPKLLSGVHRKDAYKRAINLLKVVEIADRKNHKPSQLSGGQQQRVAIARALIAEPEILLADEPTGNLDEKTGDEIIKLLQGINSKLKRTIILVTHNPDYIHLGNKVFFMRNGNIVKREMSPVIEEKNNQIEQFTNFPKRSKNLKIGEIFRLSKLHFFSKRLRTFLTTLGVALGVGSIVTLVSLGIGLQKITASQLASLDALVTVAVSTGRDSVLKLDDKIISRFKNINYVSMVSPSVTMPAKATLQESTSQVLINGLLPEAINFEGVALTAGNKFSEESGVIISKAAAKNFDISDPSTIIGKVLKLNVVIIPEDTNDLTKFKNIEIEEKIVGVSSDETMSTAYMSLNRLKDIAKVAQYNSIKIKADDRRNVELVKSAVEDMGFKTITVVDLIKRVDKIFLITQIVLGIIGGVALIVALIGIVNIMTISLLERTHEVGIMKAIGATNKDISRIFEYEVFLFGFCGAVFGVGSAWLFGVTINEVVGLLMAANGMPGKLSIFITPFYFALEMVILTILISLVAGWYPARRAAKLSPMEALRYE